MLIIRKEDGGEEWSEPCRHKCLLLKCCWLPPRHFPRQYAYLLLWCIPSSCSFANCIEYSADSHGKTSLLGSLLQPVVPTPPEDYSDFLFQAGTVWRQLFITETSASHSRFPGGPWSPVKSQHQLSAQRPVCARSTDFHKMNIYNSAKPQLRTLPYSQLYHRFRHEAFIVSYV